MCDTEPILWMEGGSAPRANYSSDYYTHQAARRLPNTFIDRLGFLAAHAVWVAKLGYPPLRASAISNFFAKSVSLLPPVVDKASGAVMWLPSARGGRLLDVGCGDGHFLARMRDLGWTVVGVEPDMEAAAVAQKTFGVSVVQNLTELSADGARYDAITLSHVIEHVEDPITLLHVCCGLVRAGGTLVVVTPNVGSAGHRLLGEFWPGLDPARHKYLFGMSAMRAVAARAGIIAANVDATYRWAPWVWRTGWHLRTAVRGSQWPKILIPLVGAALLYLFEWGVHGLREELVLVARKPA